MPKYSALSTKINKEAVELWQNYFDANADVWMPLIYPPLVERCLVFVGLNPSFSKRGFSRILKDTIYEDINPEEFYHWRNMSVFDWDKALDIEIIAKMKYSYFRKFSEIAKDVEEDWEHIDLFLYRETNQSRFKSMIMDGNILTQFGMDQIELAKKLLEELKPIAIIVANAFASTLVVDHFFIIYDENLGCHILRQNDRNVPIFLSSMLTGQRALDRFSYQRLRWHIKKVLSDWMNAPKHLS